MTQSDRDNVTVFPAPHDMKTPNMALLEAMERGLEAVLIIGGTPEGDMFLVTSGNVNNKDALWLAEHAKLHAMGFNDGCDE